MMNIFSRKPVAEPEISGTEALRDRLRSRIERPSATSYGRVASDINDALADAANRATARATAERMAPPGADEAVLRSLATSVYSSLAVSVTAVTAERLAAFVGGADLSPEVKSALAAHLHGGHAVFNAESDRLESAYRYEPHAITGIPPQWQHPDPAVRKAQANLKAAMLAARGPAPLRTPVPPMVPSMVAISKPRAGRP